MRIGCFFLVLTVLFLSCAERIEETGNSIVEKSIEAHGGWDAYHALEQITFDKTTRLFKEDGSLESEQIQRQDFRLQPNFLLRMSWKKDALEHVIFYDQMNAEVFEDSMEVKTPKRIESAKKIGTSAVYVLFQPFKLISDRAQLVYVGETNLFDSLKVKEVTVHYPNEATTTDLWSYYFDDVYQLVAAKVIHQDRISLILNTSFQNYNELLFNKTRTSYFVDSLGRKKYARAIYQYNILK